LKHEPGVWSIRDRTSEGPPRSILIIEGPNSRQHAYSHYVKNCPLFLNVKLSSNNSAYGSKTTKEVYSEQGCIKYACYKNGLEMLIDPCYKDHKSNAVDTNLT